MAAADSSRGLFAAPGGQPGGAVLDGGARRNRDALIVEALKQRRIARRIGLESAAIGEGAVHFRSLDPYVAHAVMIDLAEQLREGNVLVGRRGGWRRFLLTGVKRPQRYNEIVGIGPLSDDEI
jgi:hypothetical protein